MKANRPSKLALFNSVKSSYRLTSYQPQLETAIGRAREKREKSNSEALRLAQKVSDKGLSFKMSPEIESLFPIAKPKKRKSDKSPAQIAREKRRQDNLEKRGY